MMTKAVPRHFIFDNILDVQELVWIYHILLTTPKWTLCRTSKSATQALMPFMSFPGFEIKSGNDVHDPFMHGYFTALTFRIRALVRKQHDLDLPTTIHRVHAGGKSSFSKTEPHLDSTNANDWTILGFLNPVWNAEDGGEFYLEGHRIDYKTGRFIVFPSNLEHDGGFVVNEKLNYWRVAVNIILREAEGR